MAHQLTETNGKVEMAYTGEIGWHGLGNHLEKNAPMDAWIEAAGFNWTIERTPMLYSPALGGAMDFADVRKFANREIFYRGDNGAALATGTDAFKIVQPRETMEFFADLTGEAGFQMETAGTLYGGRKFWTLARMTEDKPLFSGGNDRIGGFCLISSSCDGTTRTEARYTSVRVVCDNTLQLSMKDKPAISISHRSEFLAAEVKKALGVSGRESFATFLEDMRRLADVKVDAAVSAALTTALFLSPEKAADRDTREKLLRTKPATRIQELFFGAGKGSELDGSKGTGWGWLNAVTEFVDHEARAKTAERRFDNALFGDGVALKARARELVEMAL